MKKYLLLLSMLAAGNSFAANKWIDEQGNVHYSDQLPPAHVKAKSALNFSTPAVPVAASSVTGASTVASASGVSAAGKTAADAAAKKAAADKAVQDAANKAQNQANCINAKQNLANLKDGMRIAVIDPNTGERSYMDDTQRQQSVDTAQQQISKYCQ